MKSFRKKIISLILVLVIMVLGSEPLVGASEVKDRLTPVIAVKNDFSVSTNINQENRMISFSVCENESLFEKKLRVKEIYILLSKEGGGEALETYKFGYRDEQYYAEIIPEDSEISILYARTIVVYTQQENSREIELEQTECVKVIDEITIEDEWVELDEIAIAYEQSVESVTEYSVSGEEVETFEQIGTIESDESEMGKENEESAEEEDEKEDEKEDESEKQDLEIGIESKDETEEPAENINEQQSSETENKHMVNNAVDFIATDAHGQQKEFKLVLNVEGYSDIKIAVWSEQSNQDDLIWYPAQKVENHYMAMVKVEDHDYAGIYHAHAYGKNESGSFRFIAGTQFTVDIPTVESIIAENTKSGFNVRLNNVEVPSGIKEIQAAIWCNGNQSDLVWKKVEIIDEEYFVEIDAIEHRILFGTYNVHFYVVDGNGFRNFCGGIAKSVEITDNQLLIKNEDQKQKKYKMLLNTLEYSNVKFAVWSKENGQDDLTWYDGTQEGNVYTAEVVVKNHRSTGVYYVHVYGYKDGKAYNINGDQFTVDAPSKPNVFTEMTSTGFRVIFDEINSPSGIEKVESAVWCSDDQSDLLWVKPKFSDGKYVLEVDIADHNMRTGMYTVHIYAEDGNGIRSCCGGIEHNVSISAKSMSAVITDNSCDVLISEVFAYGNKNQIKIAIWSEKNGQDDLAWYTAKQDGNNYRASIPIDNLKDGGLYNVHAYLLDSSNSRTFIIGSTFTINCKVAVKDPLDGKIVVDITAVNDEKQFADIIADVWVKDDKSDLQTFSSLKSSDSDYSVTIPLSGFKLISGDYHIHIYGVKKSGDKELMKEVIKSLSFQKGTIATVDVSQNKVIVPIILNDVDLKGTESSVRMAVWSETNEQDDLEWYTAKKVGNSYKADIPIYQHKDTGKYFVHIYATLNDGETSVFLAGTTFRVEEIVQSFLTVQNVNGNTGTAMIVEQIGNLGYEIKDLKVGIWNSSTDGPVTWYDMKKSSDGVYRAAFNVGKHSYQFGNFNAHVYVTKSSDESEFLNGISFNISADNMVAYKKTEGANGTVTIYGANVDGQVLSSVRMATWSDAGEQDDLKWIDAKKTEEGTYYVNIIREDYKRSGNYTTHVYGYVNGKSYCLGGVCYTVYKTGEFDEYAQEVMHNIIFAVETGGQVYGKAQYDCFAPAYNLSDKETAITIGAAGWFATEAQKLLKLTREENPVLFASLDTEGISDDIDNADWNTYGSDGNGHATILKGSAKAKCIQKLISTTAGIKVQNYLVDVEMTKYVNEAKALGVTDLKGQMFLANIRHLGGYSPMKRVVEWCNEDNNSLTMKNLYTSMRNHTANKSGNGVGADKYNSRHVKVMGWLDTYII